MRINQLTIQNNFIDNYYKKPHRVLIALIYKNPVLKSDIAASKQHADYYKQLSGKLVNYGDAMNKRGICILLNVHNDKDFENIISSDPGLLSGSLEIDVVIPYHAITE